MSAIENEKIYGLKIRESANDGSDFGTPDADYRFFFLGEDGSFHLKDAADVVTDIGPASGIPATIFDAAGDLIVATAADTAGRIPALVAAQALINEPTNIPNTSTWTDIADATVTLTTGAHRCRVSASVVRVFQTGTDNTTKLRVVVDGTPINTLGESLVRDNIPTATALYDLNMVIPGILTGVLTAAEHTIKLQGWSTGAAAVLGSSSTTIGFLTVEETLLTV